ncbi:MAG: tetratricopeptide repeat protein [Verrucomicrobiota bacterium]
MKRLCCGIFLLGMLGAGLAQEGVLPSKEETRAFDYAKRAFQDKLYDVAAKRLDDFLRVYPKSASKKDALWLKGQTWYFREKYEEALKCFRDSYKEEKNPKALLWEAETQSALKHWKEAEALYQKWINEYSQGELLPQARLGLSQVFFYQEKKDLALSLLKELQALGVKDPTGQKAILLQGKILLAEHQVTSARELLASLSAQNLSAPILFEVLYWTAEAYRQENQFDQALKFYKRITGDQRASPRELLALAWLGTGEAQGGLKKWDHAAESFEKAFQISGDSHVVQIAAKRFLDCHRQNKSLSSGAIALREFAQKTGRVEAFYSIGQAFHEAGNHDAALAELESVAKSYPASEWAGESIFLMGTILTKTGETEAAIKMFQKLVEENEHSARLRDAQLRLAELYFGARKFSEAAELYEKIAANKENDASLEQILYNAMLSFSHAKRIDEFLKTEKTLQTAFPKSKFLAGVLIEKARLYQEIGDGKKAREALESFINQNPMSEILPQALFMLSSSLYRDVDYASSAEQFRRLETQYPASELFVEARYYRIQAEWRAGKISVDQAREQYTRLLAEYPQHAMTSLIAFQVAQCYYEQKNFGDAEKAFEQFAETYPKHELADDAWYYAGRSFMGLSQFDAAIGIFEKIADDSALKTDARLAEVDCYRLLGKFDAALKIANSLLPENNGHAELNATQVEALLKKANILFAMAGENSKLYEQSLQSADGVLKTQTANIAQRNEAGFIKGKSLEKLNRPEEALLVYLDVLYGKLLPQLEASSQPEYRWFTRCGIEAAQMKENSKDIRGAIAVYRILEKISGPNREEFSQKIKDLRTRYFIWED